MKLVTDCKQLYHNIKLLSGTTSKNDPYGDKLFMVAEDGLLTILSGTRTSFVMIQQEMDGEEDGEICTSFSLLHILKMIRGEKVSLKSKQKISITDDNGFRSTLSLIETPSVYGVIKEWHNNLSDNYIELNATELRDIAKASLDFPAFQESRWVEISLCAEESFGSIQRNEVGSVDHFPFSNVSGNSYEGSSLTFNPESLLSHLAFCDKRVRISLGEAKKTPSCITDPSNASWYGLLTQTVVPQGMNKELDEQSVED